MDYQENLIKLAEELKELILSKEGANLLIDMRHLNGIDEKRYEEII